MQNTQEQATGKFKIGELLGRAIHHGDMLIHLPTSTTFAVRTCNCYTLEGFVIPDYEKPAYILAFLQYYQWTN